MKNEKKQKNGKNLKFGLTKLKCVNRLNPKNLKNYKKSSSIILCNFYKKVTFYLATKCTEIWNKIESELLSWLQ